MYNIFCLFSDFKMAGYVMCLAYTLVNYIKSALPFSRIVVQAANSQGPEMTWRKVSATLDKVERVDKKWNYQNILKRVKATCFSPSRDQHPPKFSQGVKKIASHFQVCFI